MTPCGTGKFVSANMADIDGSKGHRSYAALYRSMWLHSGLLDKQARLFFHFCVMMYEAVQGNEASQRT